MFAKTPMDRRSCPVAPASPESVGAFVNWTEARPPDGQDAQPGDEDEEQGHRDDRGLRV